MDHKNAKTSKSEEPKGGKNLPVEGRKTALPLATFTLSSFAFPLLTPSICQQVLVLLLHCPAVYTELGLFYRVLLMDGINGNAIETSLLPQPTQLWVYYYFWANILTWACSALSALPKRNWSRQKGKAYLAASSNQPCQIIIRIPCTLFFLLDHIFGVCKRHVWLASHFQPKVRWWSFITKIRRNLYNVQCIKIVFI